MSSVPATMYCLNICLPNPKLLINFIYLLKEIRNVIFGLNKSCSEFWVLSLDHLCHMMWTESCNWIKELYTWRSWCMPRSLFNNGDIARISMASRTLRSNHLASQSNILGASLPFIISTWSVVSIYVMHVLCLGIFSHIAELEWLIGMCRVRSNWFQTLTNTLKMPDMSTIYKYIFLSSLNMYVTDTFNIKYYHVSPYIRQM